MPLRHWAFTAAVVATRHGRKHRLRLSRCRKAGHGRTDEPGHQGQERNEPCALPAKM